MPGRFRISRAFPFVLLALLACAAAADAATVARTFTFAPGDLTTDRDERGFTRYTLRGGAPWGAPGSPELPGLSVLVDLPEGERAVSVRAIAGGFVELEAAGRPRPAQRPSPGLGATSYTEPDPAPYAESGWVSAGPAILGPTGSMRGRALASLVLLPLQVSPVSGRARLATRLEVEIVTAPEREPLVRERVVPAWEQQFEEGFQATLSRGPAAVRQGLESGRGWAQLPPRGQQTGGLGVEAAGRRGLATLSVPTALPSTSGAPVQYLILTNETMKASLQPLADWKTEQGQPAAVRTIEFIDQNYPFGVDRADRIRRFIRDAYTQWGTLYVLLAGDTPVIPVRTAHTTFFGGAELVTDLYYSDLDGNWNADGDSLYGEGFLDGANPGDTPDTLNLLPDVYVGRLPVETVAEAQLVVGKILNYQTNPPAGYACKALYFAEVLFPQTWVPGDPIATDGATIAEHAISRLSGCLVPTRLYENYTAFPGALPETKRAVLDSMSAGYNLLHHVGHGYRNTMSVGDSSMTNPDILLLRNSPKLSGLVYSINCTSAAIDYECIGEEFLLAPEGGGVNNIGSTNYDFPATGDGYQNEFYSLLFQEGVLEVGRAQALSKIPFVAFAAFDNVQRWTQMTVLLLGDPSAKLWTQEPASLSVSHPPSITVRDTSVTVGVLRSGLPLAGATVCVSRSGEDYVLGLTDVAGQVTLPFHPESAGSAKVTVTFTNARPYRGTITIGTSAQTALATRAEDIVVSDVGGGTNGNGNGVLDAGETVNLTLPVRNLGGAATGNVTATLLSLDARATVLTAAGSYGVIPAGGSAAGTTYRLQVTRDGVLDGDELHLRLHLLDGLGRQCFQDEYLTVRVPSVEPYTRLLSDGGSGNGNQFLDIGETADLTITLVNAGDGAARGVTATLTPGAGVAVLDGAASFGNIGARAQTAGDVFRVQNLSAADPRFTLTVSDFYGPLFTRELDFTVPEVPLNAVGIGSASNISLAWTRVGAVDLMGYNVYRSSAPGGPFARRNFVAGDRIARFQDEGLAPLTRYYYYVTAVDSSTNESAPSAVVSASTNPQLLNGFPIPMGRTTPSSPVIGDLQRDGMLDVVVGSDFVYAWSADGHGVVDADGSDRTSGDFMIQGSYYASAPAISDLDNDGLMEVVAIAWETKQLFVLAADGTPRPGFPVTLLDLVWSSPAIGDIDGDGFKEIVFNSNGSRVYAFNHDGTEVRDGDVNAGTLGVFAVMGASDNYGSPALADLDNDGRLDIIAPSRDGRIYAWRWNGTNLPGFPYGPYAAFSSSPAVVDLDLNGQLDIICAADNNRMHAIRANGTWVTGFPVNNIISGGVSRNPSPALADMDGDGRREIISAGTDGMLRILRYNGSFYPGWTGVRYTTKASAASESSPVAADLDGDGQLEILIGAEDATLNGFRADGTPLPGFPIRLGGEVRGTPMIWDFDQDGDAEILLAGWDKNFYVWTYPGSYVPNPAREWVMFRHDSERTGRIGVSILVDVEAVAAQSVEALDGGIRVRWKLPADALAEGGAWRAYRSDAAATGAAARLSAVPQGYAAVGAGPVLADPDGWLAVDDRTVEPGRSYSYVVARETAPGGTPVVFGPYAVQSTGQAPAAAYLAPAFPSPGRGAQTLAFGLPEGLPAGARVRLDLYDVRGARVRTLVDRAAEPGRFVVAWDGRADDGARTPAGVYLYRLTAGAHALTGRLVRLAP